MFGNIIYFNKIPACDANHKQIKKEVTDGVEEENVEPQTLETQYKKLSGPKITGKTIDLKQFEMNYSYLIPEHRLKIEFDMTALIFSYNVQFN